MMQIEQGISSIQRQFLLHSGRSRGMCGVCLRRRPRSAIPRGRALQLWSVDGSTSQSSLAQAAITRLRALPVVILSALAMLSVLMTTSVQWVPSGMRDFRAMIKFSASRWEMWWSTAH